MNDNIKNLEDCVNECISWHEDSSTEYEITMLHPKQNERIWDVYQHKYVHE